MAYTAPNEDTVVVVGGLGTQADKAQLNGGGATKAVWDANSPSNFINTNGAPITTTAVATFTTATKVLAATGIGTGVTVGTLAYVSAGVGAHITPGVYEITAVSADSITCAQIDDDLTNDTGVTVNVGGALNTLQNALDNGVNNGALYNRYIYDNIATETITATIQVDTYGGTSSTKIWVIGYNSTLAAEAAVTITTTTNLTAGAADSNSLIAFMALSLRMEFRNINFDGGGKAASRALYCMYSSSTSEGANTTFKNCKFYGAESHGTNTRANAMAYLNCEAYLNGGDGLNTGAAQSGLIIINCSIHDNDANGLNMRILGNGIILNNIIYDNGVDGINHLGATDGVLYMGNTIYGNAGDGIELHINDTDLKFINNASIGNTGVGYDLNGLVIGEVTYFGYNLSNVNVGKNSAHYSEGADGTFANYADGNNVASTQTADALLTTITDGSENFTPEAGSDLIDAGLDRTV